ncbi:amino acid permease-domain-containing protein [Leptodontidium sp. MPI-SDFR-AT-0119]|nr:amino acid permease-domain-containing protein [Leptodontidium sp. MPI-SDFR-AT-0119]
MGIAEPQQVRAQGHFGELPRQFSVFATLALAFSITNTWIGYSATFVIPLFAGAGRVVICCLILACVACTIIALGLAELASAFPSSGGQYHFAFMVSPEKYRAPIAFTSGWLSCFGWLFTTASTVVFCAQSAVVYLIYALITFVPTAGKTFLLISLVGMVVAFVTVLATSDKKQPANVLSAWHNVTGWPDGLAFLLATGQAMYGFLGMYGATHIAEELPNPGKNVPRILVLIMLIGTCTSIPWTVAFMFSTNDLDAVGSSLLPIFTVFEQALNSKSAATFFTGWIVVIYYGALIGCFVTSGRLLWAFSRDNGLPYSKVFSKVHPTLNAPVNATILAGLFIGLFGLLYIASTTAFNSIVALAILSSNITCTIPQIIMLFRGRHVLLDRYFDLGKIFGPFCNTFSALYASLFASLFCFPIFLPAETSSMNYVSVVLVGCLLIIAALWWGGKRKVFTGLNVQIEGLEILGPEMVVHSLVTSPPRQHGSVPEVDTVELSS